MSTLAGVRSADSIPTAKLLGNTALTTALWPRWTHRSLRQRRQALRRRGSQLAPTTLARLLDGLRFSLRTTRKRLAGIRGPDRDQQFRYLTRLRRLYITLGLPVISVDTKKKEWV